MMKKPTINPPLRSVDVLMEALAGLCLLFMVLQLALEYQDLKNMMPTHYDAKGNPDAWGSKSSLILIATVAIVLYAGLTVLNRYPHLFNFPVTITERNYIKQYQLAKSLVTALKLSMMGTFFYIQLQTIRVANELQVGLGNYFITLVIFGSFVPIIIYFITTIRNK